MQDDLQFSLACKIDFKISLHQVRNRQYQRSSGSQSGPQHGQGTDHVVPEVPVANKLYTNLSIASSEQPSVSPGQAQQTRGEETGCTDHKVIQFNQEGLITLKVANFAHFPTCRWDRISSRLAIIQKRVEQAGGRKEAGGAVAAGRTGASLG